MIGKSHLHCNWLKHFSRHSLKPGCNIQFVRHASSKKVKASVESIETIVNIKEDANIGVSNPKKLSLENLPEKTLYILDGTAMFFAAYFSQEAKYQFKNAKFSSEISDLVQLHLKSTILRSNSDSSIPLPETHDFPPLLSSSALATLASQFARFIKDVNPKYLVVAFDSSKKTFRHGLLPTYKAHRPKLPDDLLSQLFIAPLVLDAMGCQCFQREGYEADDIMASLSSWASENKMKAVLVSNDKDMIQLIDDEKGIHVLKPKTRTLISVNDVIQEFGIHPRLFRDYQALMGDNADNIPGVKGIGPKIASALIRNYESIENMYQSLGLNVENPNPSPDAWKALVPVLDGVRSSTSKVFNNLLETPYQQVLLYRELATLNKYVDFTAPPLTSLETRPLLESPLLANELYATALKEIGMIEEGSLGLKRLLRIVFNNDKFSSNEGSSIVSLSPESLLYSGGKEYGHELMALFGEVFTKQFTKIKRED